MIVPATAMMQTLLNYFLQTTNDYYMFLRCYGIYKYIDNQFWVAVVLRW